MRDELLNGEIFYSCVKPQSSIERWRRHYNPKRPPSALVKPAHFCARGHRNDGPKANNALDFQHGTTQVGLLTLTLAPSVRAYNVLLIIFDNTDKPNCGCRDYTNSTLRISWRGNMENFHRLWSTHVRQSCTKEKCLSLSGTPARHEQLLGAPPNVMVCLRGISKGCSENTPLDWITHCRPGCAFIHHKCLRLAVPFGSFFTSVSACCGVEDIA